MGAGRRADAGLDIRLLGPLEVRRGAQPITLGGPKPRTLVAALALDVGRVVSVDQLVENLWPGRAPETAAHAIQVYVSQLRKGLGPVLTTRSPGYVLELEAEQIDVHRFARLAEEGRSALAADSPEAAEGALRSALALWRGPALAEFLYEPFAQAEIARLEELRLVTLEERIEADLELGRHVEVVSELEAIVQAEPLRERPRGQLMLALYRAGRQADALAAYRAAREALVEELGIEPGPELKRLEAAILRQDESLSLPEAVAAKPAMQFRRLVTILFVDVVESMALAERLDAEALGQVLQRYFETVSGILGRHGGTVEKFAGDAVMAAFGIPVSHEDDALRAARAAVEIRTGLAALNERLVREQGVGLEIRIGLESGEVVASPTGARQRLVTGEAVGIAARLEQGATSNEIVVGELAGRLIDHAAVLEPLGELEIKGKTEPVRAYRLVEIAPAAPAFERRLDAPLVGRKRELAALRKALKRVTEGGTARVAVVVGPPGVGKSRLAAELTRRAKGVAALWGRCLSYGDGITYWPLREVVRQAAPSDDRDAVLTALDAETPPPAPEIAWLFRRFCESLARERPLVVVFDDIHWAEPTFLELVDQIADRGDAPILVVCLAREELLEDHPQFLEGRENAERIVLEGLSAEETDALLEGLGGGILESDQRGRIVEAAEGNPFFLEQLLALAVEGGLVEGALPTTAQALLAARLDRLGPGERAVLERGAVVGKEFEATDVAALLDPAAAPTISAHLATLVARGFARPAGDDAFRFRHVLVQEAVYRATPKRLRAELHERFSDRLDSVAADLPELDELTGYHLEQAFRLRIELGEAGRQSERLSEDAGRRLGAAGMRAWRRGDAPATVNLLGRATTLLPTEDSWRLELLCELGLAQRSAGEADAAESSVKRALKESRALRDGRVELRAQIESLFLRLVSDPEGVADELEDVATSANPVFERLGDYRSLGRSWLLLGWVRGGIHGQYEAWEAAAERALANYRLAGSPASTCLQQIAAALYWGPTPVADAIERCEKLLKNDAADLDGRANVTAYVAGFEAQRGEFEHARKLMAEARRIFHELGRPQAIAVQCEGISADVEMVAGEYGVAEETLRALCTFFESTRTRNELATRAADLAEALYRQGDFDEAERWADTSKANASIDHLSAQLSWRPVKAKVLARGGDFSAAEEIAREAVRLSESSDGLNRSAKIQHDLGEVLSLGSRYEEAASAFERAIAFYELKGNIVLSQRTQARREDLALV